MELREDVAREIALLRERAPEVSGCVACTIDGLAIACDVSDDSGEQTAALAAAVLGLSRRMTAMAGRGVLEETLMSGTAGYAAFYPAGPTIVLTVLAEPGTNLGMLRLEGRKTAAALAALTSR